MKPYYADNWFSLYQGDSLSVLRALNTAVDCVVTSPPYFGLRDYGTGRWEGGDSDCEHAAGKKKTRYDYSLATSPLQDGGRTGTDAVPGLYAGACPDCGARRVDDQIGLEATVREYLVRLVGVFMGVRRLLTPAAVVWVNLGDSYRDRELLGVPWAFATAMKGAGFTLLADVIWSKPNPQPSSVKHRPSTAHEYVFMFGVSGRNYYGYDDVKEPMAHSSHERMKSPRIGENNKSADGQFAVVSEDYTDQEREGWRNMRSVWQISTEQWPGAHYAVFPRELVRRCILAGCPPKGVVLDPFIGSGTTAVVARQLARRCIGIDLNGSYCYDAYRRFQGRSLVLEEAGQIPLFDREVATANAGHL